MLLPGARPVRWSPRRESNPLIRLRRPVSASHGGGKTVPFSVRCWSPTQESNLAGLMLEASAAHPARKAWALGARFERASA